MLEQKEIPTMLKQEKDCIFCKIVNGDIKTDIRYEDDKIIAFNDINPQSPVHILIVPKRHIKNLNETDDDIAGYSILMARDIAKQSDIAAEGYRIVINSGHDGGQEVDHLHIHLLGGRRMKWPPG